MGMLTIAARRAAVPAHKAVTTVERKTVADFDWDEDHPGWTVISGNAGSGPGSFEEFVIEGFRGNAIVRSCIDQIITSASEAPLEAYRELFRAGQQELERDAGSDLDQLLQYPNDRDPGLALIERGLQHYYLGGNLIWEKLRGQFNRVEALLPIHPGKMIRAVTDENDIPIAFWVRGKNATSSDRWIPAEDIVLIPDLDPLNSVFGVPRLLAASQQLQVDKLSSNYVNEILANHGAPGLIIGVEKGVKEDELDRAEEKFEEKFGPARGRGKMAVISGGKTVKEIGFSLKDLELPGVRIITGERICATFTVDPRLIGLGSATKGGSSLSGSEHVEARKKLWVQTLKPLYRRITAYLDMQLAPEFGRYVVRPNYSEIEALQEGRNEQAERAKTMADVGVFSVEELRTEMGHQPELPAGQEPYHMAGPQVEPGAGKQGRKGLLPAGMSPLWFVARDGITTEEKRQHWKRWDGYVSAWEPEMYQAALGLFNEWEQRLAAATTELLVEEDTASLSGIETKQVTADSVRDWQKRMGVLQDEYHAAWLERFTTLTTSVTEVVGAGVAGELGVSFDLFDEHIQAMLTERPNLLAGGVSDTTFGAIKDSIELGMAEGEGTGALAGRVSNVFNKGYSRVLADGRKIQVLNAPQRARLIARTEASCAVNGAATAQGKASGLPLWKEWITQGDDRVRDQHVYMEGETVKIDEAFSNGSEYPNDPNERCTMLLHTRDE